MPRIPLLKYLKNGQSVKNFSRKGSAYEKDGPMDSTQTYAFAILAPVPERHLKSGLEAIVAQLAADYLTNFVPEGPLLVEHPGC